MDHDFEDEPFPGLTENPELGRDDFLAVDLETLANPLQCHVCGSSSGKDLIFLRQLIPGVHHPVGDVTVVGEEQQSLGIAIEAANRIDALRDVDEFHYCPAFALVVDRGDESCRLVEHDDPRPLGPQDLAINANFGGGRIDPGAEFGHDFAIDLDTAGNDQRFR